MNSGGNWPRIRIKLVYAKFRLLTEKKVFMSFACMQIQVIQSSSCLLNRTRRLEVSGVGWVGNLGVVGHSLDFKNGFFIVDYRSFGGYSPLNILVQQQYVTEYLHARQQQHAIK